VVLAASSPAVAGSLLQRDVARPDSSSGALVVETLPPGLPVLLDEIPAGRSPLGPVWIPARTVRVRVLRDDPRLFDAAVDERRVEIRPGATARVFLDLRSGVVLRTRPEPARLYRVREGAADSLIGETPLALTPAFLEGARFRLEARDHADSSFAGASLLAAPEGGVSMALRRVAETLPPAPPRIPVYRKRWMQWSLVALGAGLTGAAALLRREGDRWYDRYQQSSDRRVLDTYFDRAVHYDHLSLASLAVGQVLFTGGLVLVVNGSGR
jgi:hypothetical protein